MNIAKRKIILPLLLIAALALGISSGIRPAHAAGTLYTLPANQPALAAGSTFTIKIQVANIDPFNAWDISVLTDNTVISPQSLDITGNLLAVNFTTTVFPLINCINGVGTGCIATDGPGIAHSAVTGFGPPPQTAASSGLLFKITYKVIATSLTARSTIHIFADVIANGATGLAVAHTTVDGTYGTIQPPDFTITANPTSLTIQAGLSGMSMITLTSLNGFTGTVVATATSATSGVTATPSPQNVALPPSPSSYALTINVASTVTATSASVTVTGVSGSLTHSATITLTITPFVAPPDCHFVHGKLSWTHHLSLAKNPSGQTFTAHLRCDTAGAEFVQVSLLGSSSAGMFTATSAATQLQPGVVTDVTFSQAVSSTFIGTKICFTASVHWGPTAATVMANLSPVTKSGCFAVVP